MKRFLHSDRITVWCAISPYGVIGLYFYKDEDGWATDYNLKLLCPPNVQ